MAAIADFAHKFGLVLKACNLSRGRLARAVGIDKSVVSRWASGVQMPTDHNLTLLTEAISFHRTGFARADWELPSQAFAARLGLHHRVPEDAPALTLPDRPSIAVLPFQNMSSDPEQGYFADGMVEDIITALSQFRSLFVIARNSSFAYRARSPDVRQVGRELGVRYVLEGSVRKAGDRVRITGQLIDSETGAHLWADRFESLLENIFELQDKMAASIVGAVAPKIGRVEIDRAKRKPVENLDAYDCFLHGMARIYERTMESSEAALELFYRATELDRNFPTPFAMAARVYAARRQSGKVVDRDWENAETRRLAMHVSIIGRDDALALCWAGQALGYMCRDYDTAAALIDRGLLINQNLATGWQLRAHVSLWLGQHEEAIEQIARASRLDPKDPEIFRAETVMAAAFLCQGKYNEAVTWAARALVRLPYFANALLLSAAAHALAGNIVEARRIMVRFREPNPAASISRFRKDTALRRPEDVERIIEGLRLAGLPE